MPQGQKLPPWELSAMTAVVTRKPAMTRAWDAGLCTHAEVVARHRISLATGKPQKTTPMLVMSPSTNLSFLARIGPSQRLTCVHDLHSAHCP